jgi:predicted PurR-regulated permease PerM
MNQTSHRTIDISFGTILKTVAVLVGIWLLYAVKDIVLIVLTAVVIASAIEPATKWFVGRRVPRTVAVVILYIAVFTVLGLIIYMFVPTFINETSTLLQNIPEHIGSIEVSSIFSESSVLGSLPLSGEASLVDYVRGLQDSLSGYSEGLFRTLSSVFGGLVSLILVTVISFYLAVKENGIEEFIRVVTPYSHQGYAVDLWKRTQAKIGKWLQGQLLLMLIIGVLTYVGLVLLGVPNAFVFAVVAALFEVIPIFGPILAAIPAIAVAFTSSGLTLALITLGLYVVIQQLENQVIYPQVVHKVVGVPALVVLLSLLVGASLAGFMGVLLSVPIAALIMEFTHDIQKRNKELAEIKENKFHVG